MRKLKISGIEVLVYKTRVKIFDCHGDLSDDHAILILEYLHDEGFLDDNANISCEIITED
jgi:hypothetical protein|tara:strand:- start:356 stop:535 length:180 start_codon:yes stop_codon:yes gene_type:complete